MLEQRPWNSFRAAPTQADDNTAGRGRHKRGRCNKTGVGAAAGAALGRHTHNEDVVYQSAGVSMKAGGKKTQPHFNWYPINFLRPL